LLNTSDTNIPSFVTKIFGLKELFDCDLLAKPRIYAEEGGSAFIREHLRLNQSDSTGVQNGI